MSKTHRSDFPRERLLDEAETLFAQKGYDAVSVREITGAANCNLASVNYHFGGKKNLYIEVFHSRWVPRARRIQQRVREFLSRQETVSPKLVVQALAQAFLEGPLKDEERLRHSQLMFRELGHPTEALKVVADQVMKPFFKELTHMLHPVMPKKLEQERLILNLLSIFAMVIYFNFARVAVTRITGRKYDTAFKSRLVEHIVHFSLTGLGLSEKEDLG